MLRQRAVRITSEMYDVRTHADILIYSDDVRPDHDAQERDREACADGQGKLHRPRLGENGTATPFIVKHSWSNTRNLLVIPAYGDRVAEESTYAIRGACNVRTRSSARDERDI